MTSLMCLAIVIYMEARGEPLEGQIAVAQVVQNRVLSHRHPDDICDVAQQPHQFAWDGHALPHPHHFFIAAIVDWLPSLVGDATHFHSGPPPWWAPKMTYITRIGGHFFYREPVSARKKTRQ